MEVTWQCQVHTEMYICICMIRIMELQLKFHWCVHCTDLFCAKPYKIISIIILFLCLFPALLSLSVSLTLSSSNDPNSLIHDHCTILLVDSSDVGTLIPSPTPVEDTQHSRCSTGTPDILTTPDLNERRYDNVVCLWGLRWCLTLF